MKINFKKKINKSPENSSHLSTRGKTKVQNIVFLSEIFPEKISFRPASTGWTIDQYVNLSAGVGVSKLVIIDVYHQFSKIQLETVAIYSSFTL